MPTAIADILPETFDVPQTNSPTKILREIGIDLEKKTEGRVVGEVWFTEKSERYAEGRSATFTRFSFALRAPFMDNYRLQLLSVDFPPDNYPATIESDYLDKASLSTGNVIQRGMGSPDHFECETEEEFIQVLAHLFHSERVRQIIGSLIAQSG
jgi:hypothetical protein